MSKELNALMAMYGMALEGALSQEEERLGECYDIIETALDALEIIKRNRYEAIQCLAYDIYEDYILWYNNFAKVEPPITREEYDLLKEVLL